MAKYQATADCFFDGQYYPQGAIFEGRNAAEGMLEYLGVW